MKNDKQKFTMPPIPHINIDTENIKFPENYNPRDAKKSKAYKKYVVPILKREKALRKQQRKAWWSDNWIQILGLLFAFIAAVPVIIEAASYILSRLTQWSLAMLQ